MQSHGDIDDHLINERWPHSTRARTIKDLQALRNCEFLAGQMMDLSSKGSAIVQDPATQAEVASRQRRAAEREGRRRRRLQVINVEKKLNFL